MSDGGKLDKPQIAPQPVDVGQESEGVGGVPGGVQAGSGLPGVMSQRADATEQARYRMTGGREGIAPMSHVMAERRNIIGSAAARILRKPGGPAGGGVAVPNGPGAPLPGDVRAKMEPKLGADLSDVRVHTGGDSAQAAAGYGARAFTVGSDVHFNAGQFAPGSKEGDKLLAHELTHVVQGQKSGIQRKAEEAPPAGGAGAAGAEGAQEVSQPGEPAEQEADAVADQVAGDLEAEEKDAQKDKKGDKKKKKDKKKGEQATESEQAEGEQEEGKKDGEQAEPAPGEQAGVPAEAAKAGGAEDAAKAAAPSAKPAQISAKLEGVGRKVFLATQPGAGSAAAPAAAGPAGAAQGAKTGELTSPTGKPAKEGEVQVGAAPTLQLYGYGGVRKVNGVLVKDMEKELKTFKDKKASGTLNAEEKLKETKYTAIIADIDKTKGQDYLIFAGHIGVSIDNGTTIYGFTPVAPEGMPKEQVVQHLHQHTMTFPGQVKNDKPHFDLAKRCATEKGWDTDITTVTRTITTSQHAETKKKLQELAGMMPGAHGLYYSFPLSDAVAGQYFVDTPGPDGKIIKGENQANCATFPAKIGIELPEQSGNLRFFMPAMRQEAAGGAAPPKR